MAKTLEQAQAELLEVTTAMTQIRQNERLTQLTIGSGEFARTYKMQEISYDKLLREKQDLEAYIASLDTATQDFQRTLRVDYMTIAYRRR